MPDPFGLKAHSTPSSGMANYMIAFHAVPKPHPAFQTYVGDWTPEGGLTCVTAYSQLFEEEADCRSARRLYDQVKRQLVQVYSDGNTLEFIDDDANWAAGDEFWSSLNYNERYHATIWDRAEGAKLDAGLEKIRLTIMADETFESSKLILTYQFDGHSTSERADEFGIDAL